MTKIVQMEGYEIHHPKFTLKTKVDKSGGLTLEEMEKRMGKKMAALTEQYLASIPAVIEIIDTALSKLEKGKGGIAEQEALFRQGHDLKGMGGSFDYPIMGTIGEGICTLTSDDIELSKLNLALIRVHLDLLAYVAAKRIKNDTDPNAAPIIAALAEAKPK
ncbi:Hpt domain-containing protein [Sneathiella sp. CAU 1612]|uniref:Hpt domain-containing protein n=1 Tax=Sneathiella sedimenti TaxID=2816034 RepID=A0ABS3F3R3_9PROT|nr:Hpt domain-containing protein [Sneathiella sedimenti]MBO0333100.1 Hpt domain-containing protein [Sneathiella sedimenti]